MKNSPKIIVLALDGAEKSLLLEWGRSGVLPTIGALLERSTWCTVRNPPLMYAGSVWPSFYTGVSPARHGKYCSWQIRTGSYKFQRVPGYDSRFPTLWDVLSQHGKKVAVIDAPKSTASSATNGVQIVDWATEDFPMELTTWPADLRDSIDDKYGRNEIIEADVANQGFEGIKRMRGQLLERLRAKARMTEDLLAQDDWDFFFSLFTEVHTAGHVAWHLHDRDHPLFDEQQAERIGDVVRDVYVATDAALARVMKRAGPDTLVLVYSVNGMGPDYTGNHLLDDMLLAIDRSMLNGPRRALTRVADRLDRWVPGRIYDAAYPLQRSMRRAFGLPVRDREFRTAFRVPTNQVAGGIRLNLEGREPHGSVPARDYDSACDRLEQELAGYVNTATGQPAIKSILRTHQVYAGEHLDDLPDLLVEWPQDGPVSALHSPSAGSVNREYGGHRTGDHRPDGIVFLSGATDGRGEMAAIDTIDFAPTLARLLGTTMEGVDGTDRSAALGLNETATRRA